MQINPYASPATTTAALAYMDDSRLSQDHQQRIEATQRRLWPIRYGDAALLLCLTIVGLRLAVGLVGFSPPAQPLLLSAFVFIQGALILVLYGVATLALVPALDRGSAMGATAMQLLGMAGITAFLMSLAQRPFTGGLIVLFAAASFATLLSSQALTAFVIRNLALRLANGDAVNWSYAAIIGYAVCASIASAWAMSLLPRSTSPWLICFLIVSASLSATFARYRAVRHVAQPKLKDPAERSQGEVHEGIQTAR